jgi:hypothetical protein
MKSAALLCGLVAVALSACAATAPRASASVGVERAFEHYGALLRAMDHAGIAAMFAPAAIDAFLTAIFHQRVRVPQGKVVEVSGRLEAHWIRAGKDGWLVKRMATSPL